MQIFGFRIGHPIINKRRRKTETDKLKEIADSEFLYAAEKNPEVMATLLGKYCDIWAPYDNEVEAIKQKIRATLNKKVEQTARTSRRRELDNRINEIIDRVLPGDDKHAKWQYGEELRQGKVPGGKYGPPDIVGRYHETEPGLEGDLSWLAFLEGLVGLVALSNLAGHHNRGGGDSRRKIYMGEHNGQAVEIPRRTTRFIRSSRRGLRKVKPDISLGRGSPGGSAPTSWRLPDQLKKMMDFRRFSFEAARQQGS